jgi:two-component system invasion response regulator UvrY
MTNVHANVVEEKRPTPARPAGIRILIADDHEIVRAGLKQFIAGEKDMVVSGEAADGMETLACVRKGECDVVLLDISMPDMNGIDTLKQIKRSKPDLPVLILTMHPEDHYAINLLRAGANGYVCKECAPEQLVGAIRTVASGRRYVSPALGDQLAGDLSGDGQNALHTELSEREFQVFCKLAAGQAVSEIADELFLSVKTVSTYRSRILEKMGMKTNANITYYAIKHGLIQ